MSLLLTFVMLPLLLLAVVAAGAQAGSPYAASWTEMLRRAAENHSPTPEEIAAAGSPATQPDATSLAEAVPAIRKALLSPDNSVRTFALTALTGLELQPPPAAALAGANSSGATASAKPDTPLLGPGVYVPQVAAALAPIIAEMSRSLIDETASNRILAATVLAGFAPSAPPTVYPPLLAYLKRDDGVGPTGIAVVDDLVSIGPVSISTADALVVYLRRSDQTADSRSSLIDSIANHANQDQTVNKALLAYLNTDEPSVRARLILSLPRLDLAPDVFTDTRARIANLASDNQENLQVVNAAKAVSSCWTASRMPAGCPVY